MAISIVNAVHVLLWSCFKHSSYESDGKFDIILFWLRLSTSRYLSKWNHKKFTALEVYPTTSVSKKPGKSVTGGRDHAMLCALIRHTVWMFCLDRIYVQTKVIITLNFIFHWVFIFIINSKSSLINFHFINGNVCLIFQCICLSLFSFFCYIFILILISVF